MRSTAAMALLAGCFALPSLVLWACGGTLAGPRVCSQRDACAKGNDCVLGRCRKNKTMPVSTNAPRLRFDPVDLAWADGASALGSDEIGDRFVLGQRGRAGAKLYLRFALAVPPAQRIQRALLIVEPLRRCARTPGRMTLEVAHIVAPWRSSTLGSGKRPRLATPMHVGEASVTPPQALRIDVTEIVKAWAKQRKRYHGIALMAAGHSTTGACYSSGLTTDRGPHLNVYLWPDTSDAGVDSASDAGDARDADGDANDATAPTEARERKSR